MAKFTAHTTVKEDTEAPSTVPSHAYKVLSFDDILSGDSVWSRSIYLIP